MNEGGPPPLRDAMREMVAEEWEDRYERPRGLLTDIDRRFLWGIKDYAHETSASNRRGDIRTRVENGLLDLSYLTMLSERSCGSIFDELEDDTEPGELRGAIASLIEFLYIGLDGDQEWIEETVARGVSNGDSALLDEEGPYYAGSTTGPHVDVEIEVTRGYDVDEIEERFRAGNGNTLTPAEVGVLVREGRIASDEIGALDFTADEWLNPETGDVEDPPGDGEDPVIQPLPTPDEDGEE